MTKEAYHTRGASRLILSYRRRSDSQPLLWLSRVTPSAQKKFPGVKAARLKKFPGVKAARLGGNSIPKLIDQNNRLTGKSPTQLDSNFFGQSPGHWPYTLRRCFKTKCAAR